MTINTCLSFVDGILPNAVPRATKCRWLGELEGRVRVELLGNAPEQQTAPDEAAVPSCRCRSPTTRYTGCT